MKDLLEYLVREITGRKDLEVTEQADAEGGVINLTVNADPSVMGLIIGKQGKTIRTIRNLVKVRATLEKKAVNVSIEEESSNKPVV